MSARPTNLWIQDRLTSSQRAIEHNRRSCGSQHCGRLSLDVTSNVRAFREGNRRRGAEAMAGIFGV